MQHKRILVLGCPGSGKSTFARRLGTLTGLPVVHLDRLFWRPGWVQAPKREFYPDLLGELQRDAWIIDGNFTTTLPWRLRFCDLVIWFGLPRLQSLLGIVKRVLTKLGQVRPDMTEGCPEKIDWEFIRYTWAFKKTGGPETLRMIQSSGKPAVTFRSRRDARRFLEAIRHDDTTNRENNAPAAE